MQRRAKDQQGVGLAEAVAGVALDRQGPPGELAGSIELVLIELDAGQGSTPGLGGGRCIADAATPGSMPVPRASRAKCRSSAGAVPGPRRLPL
jgi:hypothetical protein